MRHVSVISGHPISTGFRGLTGYQQDSRDKGVTSFSGEGWLRDENGEPIHYDGMIPETSTVFPAHWF